MTLAELDTIIRQHARFADEATLASWLTYETLCRYREWVPVPAAGETRLVDIGCYQPSIGYYHQRGWTNVVGVFKEEGECCFEDEYASDLGAARTIAVDVEAESIPLDDGWADVVLMMEVFEHFGIDPMHALWEANRVLKPGGRLVFSTPNAASFNNVYRILRGSAPYGAQEFNGYSTNRHNRIYDASELRAIIGQAGFRVDAIASRSYRQGPVSFRERSCQLILAMVDAVAQLRSGQKSERGEWLFVQATKDRVPTERYPSTFYFRESEWPSWLERLRRNRENAGARR